MNLDRWDVLEAEMVEMLLNEQATIFKAIGAVARGNPLDKVNDLLLASISACANFNDNFSIEDAASKITLEEKYNSIAGLSADIAGLWGQTRTCADLVAHWEATGDNFFDSNHLKQ